VRVRSSPSDERGFALMGALWLVVILAVMGLEFALETKAITGRVSTARDYSVARAAADGGIEFARETLTARLRDVGAPMGGGSAQPDPWMNPHRFVPDTLEIGQALVVVRMEDAGRALHLNRATEVEFRRLMTALRIDDSDADRLTQAILDWRDMDNHRRGRGAEEAEYEAAGRLVPPTNGLFADVGQLTHVLGMTAEIQGKIAPLLTVEGSGRINLGAAPEEVIWTVPGMTQELLSQILRARASRGRGRSLRSFLAELDPTQTGLDRVSLASLLSRVISETEEVLVTAEAWVPGSPIRISMGALAIRAGGSVFLVDRGVR
jgi:general secretion pathway protein K